jgi:hypothetical protein
MAAAPIPSSPPSWNPAVPPPPVAGAAVTIGLADRRGVADGSAEGLPLGVGVMMLDVPLDGLAGVVELAPEGDNEVDVEVGVGEGSDREGRDPEHAATDRDASMVTVAQPTAVRRARRPVPVMIVRMLADLLMPGEDGGYVFPSRNRKGNRSPARRIPQAPKAFKAMRTDGAVR